MYIDIVYILLGILILMLGRKLLWLFSGAVAFVFAVEFLPFFLRAPQYIIWIIALVLSIVAIVLSFVMQKVGVGAAGFMAGGYIAVSIIEKLRVNIPWMLWVIFSIGAILGVVITLVLFDWALIILSALSGSFLIVHVVDLNVHLTKILFMLLTITGVATQYFITKPNN